MRLGAARPSGGTSIATFLRAHLAQARISLIWWDNHYDLWESAKRRRSGALHQEQMVLELARVSFGSMLIPSRGYRAGCMSLFPARKLTKCSSRPPSHQLAFTNAVARRRLNMALAFFGLHLLFGRAGWF